MSSQKLRALALVILLSTPTVALNAQPTLTAFAGVVAGVGGSATTLCSQLGMPSELSFFALSLPFTKLGGVAACGYDGGFNTLTATTGPLVNSRSLSPVGVEVPANGTTFDGTADSRASYGSLGAAAHANISAPVTNGGALFSSMAAATFTDYLNATSPFVAAASAGFVRYRFSVDGSLSALGASAPFFFGETYTELDISHNGGLSLGVMNATVRRGELGKISNQSPPVGWTTGVGTLIGASTFFSLDFPIVWGTPWQLEVGLLTWADGRSDANFLNTAKITGVELFDAAHAPITSFNLTAQSGIDYLNVGAPTPPSTTVPEPDSVALLLLGIAVIGAVRVRGFFGDRFRVFVGGNGSIRHSLAHQATRASECVGR
ncbi:MAG: PEP-CTERM sorting domain-containing protein [Gemmatimonas sp.]